MSNEKFTPGPWQYDDSTGFVESCDEIICDTLPTGDPWHDANSHLIAAAPDMYKMLKLLVSNDSINDHSIDAEVKALLAKARGES